jgi:hypothetical protein
MALAASIASIDVTGNEALALNHAYSSSRRDAFHGEFGFLLQRVVGLYGEHFIAACPQLFGDLG